MANCIINIYDVLFTCRGKVCTYMYEGYWRWERKVDVLGDRGCGNKWKMMRKGDREVGWCEVEQEEYNVFGVVWEWMKGWDKEFRKEGVYNEVKVRW